VLAEESEESMSRPFAIVTGASSGIGLELATICAQEGFDLLLAADRSEIHGAADRCRSLGADVIAVEADLATTDGVDQLWRAAAGRSISTIILDNGVRISGGLSRTVAHGPRPVIASPDGFDRPRAITSS